MSKKKKIVIQSICLKINDIIDNIKLVIIFKFLFLIFVTVMVAKTVNYIIIIYTCNYYRFDYLISSYINYAAISIINKYITIDYMCL